LNGSYIGGSFLLVSWKLWEARPTCLRLFVHCVRRGRLANFLHRRHQQGDENRDDRDHHQQLNEREAALAQHLGEEHAVSFYNKE